LIKKINRYALIHCPTRNGIFPLIQDASLTFKVSGELQCSLARAGRAHPNKFLGVSAYNAIEIV